MDPLSLQFMRRQHGAVAAWQLVTEGGLTRGQFDAMVRHSQCRPLHWGVVAAAGAPDTPELEVMAAVLRVGRGARAIGPRVLSLYGIRGFGRSDDFGVLVPASRRLPVKVSFQVFRDPAPDDGTALLDGIPAPKPPRAVVEVARWHKGVELRTTIDAANWERRPTTTRLVQAARALPRQYAPAGAVRRLARQGYLVAESEQERRMVTAVGDEFGPVELQVQLTPRRRVDALLRKWRIVLEYLGADHRTEAGRRRDQARDAEIEGHGYRIVHVYAEDLDHPAALRARIWARIRA